MRRALGAEWTKLRTVPSTAWSLLALVGCTVTVSTMTVLTLDCRGPDEGCPADVTRLSLSGVYLGQAAVILLAVLAVTAEYDTGMIRTTLSADCRRIAVLAAKAVTVTAVVLVAALPGVLGSVVAGRMLLPGRGFTMANGYAPLSLTDGPTLRAAAGTVLYLGLVALLSLGVAAVIRHTAGAVTAVLAIFYVLPMVAALVSDPDWQEAILRFAPMTAGLAIQATEGLGKLPIEPWPGLALLAGYAAAALAAGAVVFRTRDAG